MSQTGTSNLAAHPSDSENYEGRQCAILGAVRELDRVAGKGDSGLRRLRFHLVQRAVGVGFPVDRILPPGTWAKTRAKTKPRPL
jgi:hypothetical protein